MKISPEVQKRVLEAIDRNRNDAISFLQSLVGIPSISGEEGEAQRFVKKKLDGMGLDVDLVEGDVEELKKYPGFFETEPYLRFGYGGRPNVVGKWSGCDGGRSLILSGHIDTVPPGPVHLWKHHPFMAEIEDGRIYGRGTADMKAGVAAMIYAFKSILDSGMRPGGDVFIQTTIEEEAGGWGGAPACILKGYKADAVIITEPTRCLTDHHTISIAGPGGSQFRIRVSYPGPSTITHVAGRVFGINTIEKAIEIYNGLMDLNRYRQKTIDYKPARTRYPELKGRVTRLTVGKIRGGDRARGPATWTELEGYVSWPPEETVEEVRGQVERKIEEVANADTWMKDHHPQVWWTRFAHKPYEQDRNHPLVQMVKNHMEDTVGRRVEYCGAEGFSDARFYVEYVGCPTIHFGPQGVNIHRPDEFTSVDSLLEVTKTLALTILSWCGYT